jgi:hypothetical protein
VFDFNGSRFVEDLGADNYALPGYFDDRIRYHYYRLGSWGHSLVLVANESQTWPTVAPVTEFNMTATDDVIDG